MESWQPCILGVFDQGLRLFPGGPLGGDTHYTQEVCSFYYCLCPSIGSIIAQMGQKGDRVGAFAGRAGGARGFIKEEKRRRGAK